MNSPTAISMRESCPCGVRRARAVASAGHLPWNVGLALGEEIGHRTRVVFRVREPGLRCALGGEDLGQRVDRPEPHGVPHLDVGLRRTRGEAPGQLHRARDDLLRGTTVRTIPQACALAVERLVEQEELRGPRHPDGVGEASRQAGIRGEPDTGERRGELQPAAATRRSQAIANPNPAPTHGPLIAATIGKGSSITSVTIGL